LYGAIFVKGVPLGLFHFLIPLCDYAMFDLGIRFFIPTERIRVAGAQERSWMARSANL
jgi:hypothetical protein